MLLLVKYTLLYMVVLMVVALGGMFSERSGIINIALEGIMVIGGLAGVLAAKFLALSPFWTVTLSILIAGLSGMIYALLLGYASINLKADQTIGGTALNILATALAMVVAKRINGTQAPKLDYVNAPFLFNIGSLELNVFIPLGLVLLLISYFILYKTRLGLRLRSCGEHPQAADSVGINVYKMRYIGVMASGFLGGIGGFAYILPAVSVWNFEQGVTGMGFLALAVMIFGQWKPFRIFLAAIFFSLFRAMANIADSFPGLKDLNWPKEIYNMMPFIASMILLALTSKKSRAPKAEGVPYDKGAR
ncbi:MAG: ABC transporter permease [Clostridia bacterium]|nr:ABC transporter permease [Clostridiales bacterium]MBQ2977062.1 ABC transporter permease [Clostridia bacterium]MDD6684040.1 ABC transporter permease [Clostridiales bacterium]